MPARILIVEDNATNLELMAYVLEAFGHAVERAHDGEAGLAALKAEEFDLVLADILMPKMDGYEVAARIKADPATKAIPVIAVTALAMAGDREKILRSGFEGYVPKPINPETFVHDVDRFLKPELRSTEREKTSVRGGAQTAPPSGRTILVVDDVSTNIMAVRAAIEPFGHKVIAAHSMLAAIDAAHHDAVDLIIADVHMPDGDGFDLIRACKADPMLARIPFIFLSSSYWHDLDKARGLPLGAEKFLVRPIDPQLLVAEVTGVLEARRTR